MTGLTLTIPTFETERLILRAACFEDQPHFVTFYGTERARFVGGPLTDKKRVSRSFNHIAGLWVLRGVSLFMAETKENPGIPIGSFGPYQPLEWPEMEFGWTLYDPACEGKGYVQEAMKVLIPWTWEHTGKSTIVSYIDDDNFRSQSTAKALGATRDETAEQSLNQPGMPFYAEDGPWVTVWRHQRSDWETAP